MAIAHMFQYAIAMLLVAKFAGNRFVNGILFGCAYALSMVFSGLLLTYMSDMKAFRIVVAMALTAYVLLVSFTDSPTASKIAIVLLVAGLGGWVNILQLIIDIRVPPLNVASVAILTRTVAVGTCVLASTVASLDLCLTYILLSAVAICGLAASFMLPEPGQHL